MSPDQAERIEEFVLRELPELVELMGFESTTF